MIQRGIVTGISEKTAEIEITRSSSCGESCASCGLCPGLTAKVSASNDIGAALGDTVTIDMADKKILGAAALVYIVPLAVLIIGYFIAYAICHSELISAAAGFLLMALTFVVLILSDKRLKRRYTPRITKIIPNENTRGHRTP